MPKRISAARVRDFELAAQARARSWVMSEQEGALRPEAFDLAYDMAGYGVEVRHKGGLSRAAMHQAAVTALQQAEVWVDALQVDRY